MEKEQHWLIMTVGLPRSGKTTWINKNKKDEVIVSHDWIRENILGTKYEKAANAVVWTLADATLRIVLGQGKSVILDGINHTISVRKFFIDIARQYGAKVRIIYFRTPLEVCLSREEKIPKESLIEISEEIEFPLCHEYDKLDCVSYIN